MDSAYHIRAAGRAFGGLIVAASLSLSAALAMNNVFGEDASYIVGLFVFGLFVWLFAGGANADSDDETPETPETDDQGRDLPQPEGTDE